MQHDDAKQRQETSLVGRIFSLEVAMFLMGVASLIYGLLYSKGPSIFFGALIIPGVFVLHKVKNKDWKAHWAEMEEQPRRQQQREEERKRDNT
jgi:inner membrane protein involved in colicin E2 resistance